MRKLLKIYFNEPLHAVFPTEFVDKFDYEKNALILKKGWRVLFLAKAVQISDPAGNYKITVPDQKIEKIEILFKPLDKKRNV